MANELQVSLTGYAATNPELTMVGDGTPKATLRVAATPRRRNRNTGEWADGPTSFMSVTCWRKLAENIAMCLRKGDPVVVTGRLTVRQYEGKDGSTRTNVEVEATSVGHDLSRGVAHYLRPRRGQNAPAGLPGDSAGAPAGPSGDDEFGVPDEAGHDDAGFPGEGMDTDREEPGGPGAGAARPIPEDEDGGGELDDRAVAALLQGAGQPAPEAPVPL